MKLNEQSPRSNTNIVNALLSEDKRYQRQNSSLDYKSKSKEKLTTTKPTKKKDQQQVDQQPQQYNRRKSYATRARERNGLPPKRYDISDIDKMDEYELMMAIREDPEFAAAVQKYSEEYLKVDSNKEKPSKPTSPPTGAQRNAKSKPPSGRKNKAADGAGKTLSTYPNHVRELMGSGVPVTQWVILFILLGAGFFQLRKMITLPDTKKSGNRTKVTRRREKGVDMTKKTKSKPKQGTKPLAPTKTAPKGNETFVPKNESPSSSETVPESVSMPPPPANDQAQKGKKKKKKTKAMKTSNLSNEEKYEPDVISTDGSTQQDNESADNSPHQKNTIPIIEPITFQNVQEDDTDGWETVTKSRRPSPLTPTVARIVPQAEVTNMEDSKEKLGEHSDQKEVKKETTKNGSQQVILPTKQKVSNKKKQQKPTTTAVQKTVTTTEDDAALALKLQLDEVELAKEMPKESEEAWEEVTTKKKPKGQKGTSD